MRRCHLSLALLLACAAVFSSCLSAYVGFPSRGTFRVVSVKEDGTLVARRSGGREYWVRLYGVRTVDDWEQAMRGRGYGPPRVVELRNGDARIIEKDGRLVYNRKYVKAPPWRNLQCPNIVESDGLTPTRDKEGNVLAIVMSRLSPPACLQDHLIICGFARPDPDIVDDPFVDTLRKWHPASHREW